MEHVKVLLIEDNPGDARLIKEMLAEERSVLFDLEWEDNLSKGLKRLTEGGIEVVLLDLMLPDSGGFDTFANTQAKAPEIPILVFTGIDDETLAIKAVHEGAQDYQIKGQVDSNQLVRAIRYAIERKRTEEKMKTYATELEEANRLKDIYTYIMRDDLLKLQKSKLDLNEFFRAVVDHFKPYLEKKNMKLEYLAKDECFAMVNPLIENVFSNLISNAIKYSPQGNKIEANIIKENSYYKIYVKDWGYGIKDEDKEKIFTFQSTDKMRMKGMGLAVVKRIVKLHGGKVWMEDNAEGGSVFYVKIPRD